MGDELTEDDQRDMEGLGADDPARDPALLQFQLRVARAPDQVRFHAKTRAGGRAGGRAHTRRAMCALGVMCVSVCVVQWFFCPGRAVPAWRASNVGGASVPAR